ncbi:MAG: ADP-ribosylglycohydrolase family protein [Candidatus Bathyarchaeota archaeon]
MLGAIAGDIIGSVHEFDAVKTEDFPLFVKRSRFTDDSVLTIATAEKLLEGGDYAASYRKWANKYPAAGYGGMFREWFVDYSAGPYNSFGNGSAMRIAPVGFAFDTLEEVLKEARKSAETTHNHPEGVKGAQATAAAVFLARKGRSKKEIAEYITREFSYKLTESVAEIRSYYEFNESCQGTVPQAIISFLESNDYEDAIRKAISLGGDADTLACITGGIAQAFYGGVPEKIVGQARAILCPDMLAIVDAFMNKFKSGPGERSTNV